MTNRDEKIEQWVGFICFVLAIIILFAFAYYLGKI